MEDSPVKRKSAPVVLYKYRDWNSDYHRRVITHNEIYFASPQTLNDPFDIAIKPTFRMFTPEALTRIAEASYARRNLSADEKTWRRANRRCVDIRDDEAMQGAYIQWFGDFRDNCFGVCSLTSNPLKRTMWAHYAQGHTGFAVGFRTSTLQALEDAPSNARTGIRLREVVYYDECPEIAWEQMLEDHAEFNRYFLIKHSELAYEEEWRLLMLPVDEATATRPLSREERIVYLPEGAITNVVFGLRTGVEAKKEICRHLLSRVPRPELYQVVRGEGWQLQMEPIDYDS